MTIKYLVNCEGERLHHYLKLKGKYVRNYPETIIKRDGTSDKMDWLMLVKYEVDSSKEILINVEFPTKPVDDKKLQTMSENCDYCKKYYRLYVCSAIVIGKDYESSKKEYKRVVTDIFHPHYIHLDWNKLLKKLNNLEDKIKNQEDLTDDEALDFVFISMYAPEKYAKDVTEKIIRLFAQDKSITKEFRVNIAYSLSIMIKKYFGLTQKGEELEKFIEEQYVNKSAIRDIIEFETDFLKKQLAEKDNEIAYLRQQLEMYNAK